MRYLKEGIKPRPLTEEKKKTIITMYDNNVSMTDIGRRLHIPLSTISSFLRRIGKSKSGECGIKLKEEDLEPMLDQLFLGKDKLQIARKFGVSKVTVNNFLHAKLDGCGAEEPHKKA